MRRRPFRTRPQTRRFAPPLLASLALALAAAPACAAESDAQYPSKPIRFIVPFTAGGLTDKLARSVAHDLQEAWQQPVIVENKPGAGGTIGADHVAKAAGDGYTILLGTHATHAINVTLLKNLPYDAVGDFTPVSLLATVPNVLMVHPSVPANNVQELVQLARRKPGTLNFISQGIGTSGHMSGELLKSLAGIDMTHIPARGPAQALSDVMGGHADILFDSVAIGMPVVQSGKVRALAVTGRERSPAAPDLPTMIEAGVPDYEIVLWFSVFAPKDTPPAIVAKLNREIVRSMNKPSARAGFVQDGMTVAASSPEQLRDFQKAEIVKWAKLIKASGASAN
ncbi:Tripartite tricarboxylate transporter family receptor [Pigmentiphaga humi]|uniref:Tripartite tricarboxylate transporter family receptor n=1 Tax=Pigmentiphaga humi TaxID=2478468 RepID=A0A3P4AXA5_9BURK|nr:tripartite tricarboxylate transporter substrate binding protein [Pigmentiphaga humi]VCU68694.1 Tripartite tricarboxylate transporter family receptor [Pigmentiphaga humi]